MLGGAYYLRNTFNEITFMKKEMIAFVKSLGGDALYSGAWPKTLYVQHRHRGKDYVIDLLIKRFGRHTGIKFE